MEGREKDIFTLIKYSGEGCGHSPQEQSRRKNTQCWKIKTTLKLKSDFTVSNHSKNKKDKIRKHL